MVSNVGYIKRVWSVPTIPHPDSSSKLLPVSAQSWYRFLLVSLWGGEVLHGVMIIAVGNVQVNTSPNHGQDCISHSTNTLGKGMNPIILSPAMGK